MTVCDVNSYRFGPILPHVLMSEAAGAVCINKPHLLEIAVLQSAQVSSFMPFQNENLALQRISVHRFISLLSLRVKGNCIKSWQKTQQGKSDSWTLKSLLCTPTSSFQHIHIERRRIGDISAAGHLDLRCNLCLTLHRFLTEIHRVIPPSVDFWRRLPSYHW